MFKKNTICIIILIMLRLMELRKECGFKRSKVAEDLKINAGTLANYENEIRQAPYEWLLKFADYYGVSADYLLGRGERELPLKAVSVLSAEEAALVADFRKLGKTGKARVAEYIELWLDRE